MQMQPVQYNAACEGIIFRVASWLVATLDADYRMVRFFYLKSETIYVRTYVSISIYYSCIQESQVAGRTTTVCMF